ncbi:MAG: hypothetical protein V2B14_01920 [bacterium]
MLLNIKNLVILFSVILFFNVNSVFAQTKPAEPSNNNKSIDFQAKDKQKIKINEPVKKIDDQLFKSDEEIQNYFQIQKKIDIEDIKSLWESTIERNTVIKFALKKLALPAEQRRIHSSLMVKTVSTLISGAAILPNIFGADTLASTASFAGGSLANRVISSKSSPKQMPLTDTELIQLARLIEDLQNKLIKGYYDYKSTIDALKVCRQNLFLQNKNYSNALKSGNEILIIASSALYDKELYNEMQLKQEIKIYRLELERLAGTQAVANLNLTGLALNKGVKNE